MQVVRDLGRGVKGWHGIVCGVDVRAVFLPYADRVGKVGVSEANRDGFEEKRPSP